MNNPNDWGFPITDNLTGKKYSCDSNILMKDLCKVVNRIVDENEQLKKDNETLQQRNNELSKRLKNKEKECVQIKQTIHDSMENERTHIGHNVLKQLLEAIQ